jgi:hypothetical protein
MKRRRRCFEPDRRGRNAILLIEGSNLFLKLADGSIW